MACKLVVIIPAFNEEQTVAEIIAGVPRSVDGVDGVEVIVINDGSTDATAQMAIRAGATVVSHSINMGVGAALQTGLDQAIKRGADVVVNIDADGQFSPSDIPTLVAEIISGRADMASASRFKDPALVPTMPLLKLWGNRAMSWLVSTITGRKFHDVSCGFRAYSREAINRLVLTGRFTYTQEMFIVFSFKGLSIIEKPLKVKGVRTHGQSKVASSIWRYAWRTSGIIFGCLRDYRPNFIFNTAASLSILLSFILGLFFIIHYLITGSFHPHRWAGFVATFFFFLGSLIFLFAQVAAMLGRIRFLQEEQLYLLKTMFNNTGRGGEKRGSPMAENSKKAVTEDE